MNARSLFSLLIVSAGLVAGCDGIEGVDEDLGEVTLRPGGGGFGGVWLNTSLIGATLFSEIDLKGASHDGVRFNGLQIRRPGDQWLTASSVSAVDGNLKAKVGTTTYSGADLVGSRWQLTLVEGEDDEGVAAEIWIASHVQVSPDESRYVFETLDLEGNVVPVCDADSAGNHTLIPIKDVTVDAMTGAMATRKDTVYLACTSGAVGKAIVWGYKPWDRVLSDFEVATRVVRADYCFDGTPWTETGTSLQLRDKYNINTFVHASDPTEVVWTKTGAACVGTPRSSIYSAAQVVCDGQALPLCPSNTSMTTFSGTLFWTKINAS
ncbi:ADYC domain-containing protein [Nannocystis sp.]|uniref:ADYC domain-containing protein n=1 Tax=Nannocystis sp. TaxID=1962667 RepID=UPI0025D5831C|nr:ADYC domain-containing protein [Nannocystis sp.]MBK7828725.1 hypothetical protein [Nannocystis sp.]